MVPEKTSITSNQIRNQLHEFIRLFGHPKLITSDNGNQFVSKTFMFSREHPLSNGHAERFIDTMTRSLEKSL